MKKYFKLGTALAFSVLLNLSPTVIQNVHAEDANPKEEIVEKVDVNQTNTINDVLNNNSTIEVEEASEKESISYVVSIIEQFWIRNDNTSLRMHSRARSSAY